MVQRRDFKINYVPRAWQQEVVRNQTRFTVLALHRRAGKTTLAVSQLLTAAFHKVGNYTYVSPQKNQSKTNMWDIIKHMLGDLLSVTTPNGPVVDVRESDLSIRFFNGSKLWLLGAEDPDKIRGAKLTGAIVDEVAQMPREIWSEVLRPALMDSNGWAMFIGTPKGVNLFSELFYRGEDPKYPEWSAKKYTCYETGALSAKEIEAYKAEVDENTFRREMLCDFSASADNQLLSLTHIMEAIKRPSSEAMYSMRIPLVMGVDVARFGNDRSVIAFRRGQIAEEPITITDTSVPQLADFVNYHYNIRRPSAVFVDGTGIGGGLADVLTQWGLPVYDINFGARSVDPRYRNRRTEMWCKMADWVKRSGILPDNSTLKEELCAPQYSTDEGGKILLESKKDIKGRLGYSPDLADALALTFAEDFGVRKPVSPHDDMYDTPHMVMPSRYTPVERYERMVRSRRW